MQVRHGWVRTLQSRYAAAPHGAASHSGGGVERITDVNEQMGYTVARVADLMVDIVANRLPRRFGLDPAREVQALCPMHRGPASAASAPWPEQSTPKAPDVAAPPSPNGYDPTDGCHHSSQPASRNRFRSSLGSGAGPNQSGRTGRVRPRRRNTFTVPQSSNKARKIARPLCTAWDEVAINRNALLRP
jgi:hypothetical protein